MSKVVANIIEISSKKYIQGLINHEIKTENKFWLNLYNDLIE